MGPVLVTWEVDGSVYTVPVAHQSLATSEIVNCCLPQIVAPGGSAKATVIITSICITCDDEIYVSLSVLSCSVCFSALHLAIKLMYLCCFLVADNGR